MALAAHLGLDALEHCLRPVPPTAARQSDKRVSGWLGLELPGPDLHDPWNRLSKGAQGAHLWGWPFCLALALGAAPGIGPQSVGGRETVKAGKRCKPRPAAETK